MPALRGAMDKKKALCFFFVLLSAIAGIVKIFTGFDIDEAYALALPYRLLQGDRLFADMWDLHQTSAFLPALFLKVFSFFSPSMTGAVLYFRILTEVLLCIYCIGLFFFFKRFVSWEVSAFSALLCFNFLPKWMLSLDFSVLFAIFFGLFFMTFTLTVQETGSGWYASGPFLMVLSGIALAMTVLTYPGMLVVYPVAVVLLLLAGQKKQTPMKKRLLQVLYLTVGCALTALLFFSVILSYMSVKELILSLGKIFMDGSHQFTVELKFRLYLSQWAEVLKETAILCLPSLVLSELCLLVTKSRRHFAMFLSVFTILTSALCTFGFLVTPWGPFRLQVRYFLQLVFAFALLHRAKERNGVYRLCEPLLWLSLAGFAGVLLASNVGPVSSASYLILGNVAYFLLLFEEPEEGDRVLLGLKTAAALLFLISLLMCKGFYVRNTEYVPGNVTETTTMVTKGPLHAIFVSEADARRIESDYETIRSNSTKEDAVLYMGTETIDILYTEGRPVIPTTISTPAFNEQWVDYFTMYPDKEPTVIFLSKSTVDNREKFFAQNPFGIWIADRYDVECMSETDSLCIIRKKE